MQGKKLYSTPCEQAVLKSNYWYVAIDFKAKIEYFSRTYLIYKSDIWWIDWSLQTCDVFAPFTYRIYLIISSKQECIPVGCVPPAHNHMGGLPDRDPCGQKPPPTETPWTDTLWTEIPLDRDPCGQRPPGQRPPGQRLPPPDRDSPQTENPPGERTPRQRLPLDRDPLWAETPSGQRTPPPRGQTDTCENITSEKILSILALKAMVTCQ